MQRTIFSVLGLLIVSFLHAQQQTRPGMKAPEFQLPYATKDTIVFDGIRLSDYQGRSIILLAFYPADWSGGCTQEVCTFRDNFSKLSTLNVNVLGISGDYIFSHHEWALHHNLPFKLLSDHSHHVAKLYGSYNEDSGFNRRTVFVIDRTGTIVYSDDHYDTRSDDSFNKLQAAIGKIK
jgi:peroxiredoxin Q/BCP